VLADATRFRLQEGADLPEVQAWADRLVTRVAAALDQGADVDGVLHALWTQALGDQLYGDGLDAPGLSVLAREVAAWAIERDAERVIEALEVDL
jgi:hypothetical protein